MVVGVAGTEPHQPQFAHIIMILSTPSTSNALGFAVICVGLIMYSAFRS